MLQAHGAGGEGDLEPSTPQTASVWKTRAKRFGATLTAKEFFTSTEVKPKIKLAYVLAALLGAFALSLFLITVFKLGWYSPQVAANGIIATSLFVFILSLIVFYNIEKDNPKEFLQGAAVRTGIAISFTVSYIQMLAFSLVATQLGLNFDNPLMNNFFTVYIAIIGFYFGSATWERLKLGKGSPVTPQGAGPGQEAH
jgi:hypothetical protein